MNPHEFTARYGCTVHTDPATGERYIRLPITDLDELGYMQQALLQAALLLTRTTDPPEKADDNSMYWLCKILLASYPQDELEGLSEWLKT